MTLYKPKKRVVLIDDDADLRAIMRAAINSMNCEVVGEGGTGEEAIDLFRQHRPDLLLLDVTLETMSGTQALAAVKAEYPDAFVIMLTASADVETVQECIRGGAARYILKDTSVPRIKLMVGEALGLGLGT